MIWTTVVINQCCHMLHNFQNSQLELKPHTSASSFTSCSVVGGLLLARHLTSRSTSPDLVIDSWNEMSAFTKTELVCLICEEKQRGALCRSRPSGFQSSRRTWRKCMWRTCETSNPSSGSRVEQQCNHPNATSPLLLLSPSPFSLTVWMVNRSQFDWFSSAVISIPPGLNAVAVTHCNHSTSLSKC